MNNSRIRGLYRMTVEERIRTLRDRGFLSAEHATTLARGAPLLPASIADKMVENVIGVFGLPLAVAPNFTVNGKDYVVPMVVEEPSVVAALSNAARVVRDSGGFAVTSTDPVLIGQVQVVGVDDPDRAVQSLYAARDEIEWRANAMHPRLIERGGGVRGTEFFKYRLPDGDWTVVVHLLVDTCDAMGANIVNTMCEGVAGYIESESGGNAVLRILSNLADKSLVRAKASIGLASLGDATYSPEYVRDGIVLANDFANTDPYRAATHNKGIMNGVDAVAIATGNDWRAIEAGANAFAAREGTYAALTNWSVADNGDLVGELTLPLKPGIVGGSLSTNPGARIGLDLAGVATAQELAELMGAVGLAQNFAALKALISTGIQAGHLRLHARSVAAAAGISASDFDRVYTNMIESGQVSIAQAKAIAADSSTMDAPGAGIATGEAAGKVILLGEHAAVYDSHVLALPIPSAVTVNVSPGASGIVLDAPDWQITEAKWTAGDKNPEGAAAVVDLVLQELGVADRAFDIRVSSRIPLGVGLGSSAAFAVALIRAFDALLGRELSNAAVDRLAFRCEEITHGTPSGIDNNIATYGQPVLFSRSGKTRTKAIELSSPPPLVVASSGTRGATREMVAGVRERFDSNDTLYSTIFNEIDEMSVAGAMALREADYDRLGAMMNVCHGFLNAIEVSTPALETMVAIARESGAVGAKLTGAGGGGSIIALCPGKVAEVSAALAGAGYEIIPMEAGRD